MSARPPILCVDCGLELRAPRVFRGMDGKLRAYCVRHAEPRTLRQVKNAVGGG